MKIARMSKLCDRLNPVVLVLITGMCWLLWLSHHTDAQTETTQSLTVEVLPEEYDTVQRYAMKLRERHESRN